ncbi:MAG TPA: phosphatidylglycerophosphatase A [Candidatus Binatia bacterium]|nr:phosphatidylglycerophosphatase A [Candidatus Binatia bacterium]
MFFGGWEIVLILALIVVLFGGTFADLAKGLGKGIEEFKKATDEVTQELRDAASQDIEPKKRHLLDSLLVWIAWGFDVGRIPWAPGTFGSLVGLLWFAILLSSQSIWFFAGSATGAVLVSVWICGKAEEILQQHDPSSIVLDEICAMPLCFVPWLVSEWVHKGVWPPLETFFGAKSWYITAIIFVAFRIFDILKLWPVRQSQRLRGGWGVVMDDVLAAVYVCALSLLVFH